MKIIAKIKIENGTFQDWLDFYDSYKSERSTYVSNEEIEKVSPNEARVTFFVQDLDGLMRISASENILQKEKELGVVTNIVTE